MLYSEVRLDDLGVARQKVTHESNRQEKSKKAEGIV